MIPDFDENGYLPPGIHIASIDEIAERFGLDTEVRRLLMQSLRDVVQVARTSGFERIIVNGSFVTDVAEPGDVDCVLVGDPDVYMKNEAAEGLLEEGIAFIHLDIVDATGLEFYTHRFFSSDRELIPKGMVEIEL